MDDTAMDMFNEVLDRLIRENSITAVLISKEGKARSELIEAKSRVKQYQDERVRWSNLIVACKATVSNETWEDIKRYAKAEDGPDQGA